MKLFSQIMLIVVGLGVIYFGCNLLFQHETNEFAFQKIFWPRSRQSIIGGRSALPMAASPR